jgi:hypothetical protein
MINRLFSRLPIFPSKRQALSTVDGYWIIYTIIEAVPKGTSITATTVGRGGDTVVLLEDIMDNENVSTQTRGTANISFSNFNNYSRLVEISERGGSVRTGLAAVGWRGAVRVYTVVDKKVLELSSNFSTASNVGKSWTTTMIHQHLSGPIEVLREWEAKLSSRNAQ